MSPSGEDVDMNLMFEDAVHESMFFGNLSTPPPFGLPFERLGMASANLGMKGKFLQQFHCFLETRWLAPFQFAQPSFSLG